MEASRWLSNNYIEVFGAITGIIYVFLEIRQTIWLWPVGILTSAVYIWVFFTSKIYADMSLQAYYLVISILGWYWWLRGTERRAQGSGQISDVQLNDTPFRGKGAKESEGEMNEQSAGQNDDGTEHRAHSSEQKGKEEKSELQVTRLKLRTGIILALIF